MDTSVFTFEYFSIRPHLHFSIQYSHPSVSDPDLHPIGGEKFSQEPLGSMQAPIDFGVEHREAGLPLFILMGGWRKQLELDKKLRDAIGKKKKRRK